MQRGKSGTLDSTIDAMAKRPVEKRDSAAVIQDFPIAGRVGTAQMQSSDQQEAPTPRLARYLPWLLGTGLIVVSLVRGMYAEALGTAIGIGIIWAGAKGLIPEQGPSKTGNVIAIILVFAIVLVFVFVWWVVRGA
jgi:hypothetical protein